MLTVDRQSDMSNVSAGNIYTGFDEKKLYIVEYIYKDIYDGKIEKDEWVLACEDNLEVDKIIELNRNEFKRYGYKILSYSFRKIEETDNGYKIRINGRVK